MKIENRADLLSEVISRVINNAPVSEILRVYSLALQGELENMGDDDLYNAIETAGYADLIEKFCTSSESDPEAS